MKSRIAIEDEFSNLPITRQQRWQLRKRKAGRCLRCGKPSRGSLCLKCGEKVKSNQQSTEQRKKKLKASRMVTLALATGRIHRGKCHCGKLGQAHVRNVSRPLQSIEWLCHGHRMKKLGKESHGDIAFKITDLVAYHRRYNREYYLRSR